MDGAIDFWAAKALLEWQIELGADEPIGDLPVNHYEIPAEAPKAKPASEPVAPVVMAAADPVRVTWVGAP